MDYINILLQTGLSQIVLILFALIFCIECIVKVIDWLLNRFGIKTKSSIEKEKLSQLIKAHDEKLVTLEDNINKITIASRESLAYKINEKYRKYFQLGYIPEDEYGEFINLHDAYKGVGGNHSGDEKYNRCIDNLPIKSMKTTQETSGNE